jgi:hypothetical protein
MVAYLSVPAVNVYLPKDRVTNNHQGYGFVEFRAEEDADYVSRTWAKGCRSQVLVISGSEFQVYGVCGYQATALLSSGQRKMQTT